MSDEVETLSSFNSCIFLYRRLARGATFSNWSHSIPFLRFGAYPIGSISSNLNHLNFSTISIVCAAVYSWFLDISDFHFDVFSKESDVSTSMSSTWETFAYKLSRTFLLGQIHMVFEYAYCYKFLGNAILYVSNFHFLVKKWIQYQPTWYLWFCLL